MNAAAPSRAGFTLLEVMLAAAIGSVVAIVAVGLMATLNRADSKLTDRYREITQLERAHTIMSRAFSSILVADQTNVRVNRARNAGAAGQNGTGQNNADQNEANTPPNSGSSRASSKTGTPSRPTATPDAAATNAGGSSKATGRPKLDQPPRIALSQDGGVNGLGMSRPSNARLEMGEVQRFEIVLAASPVPPRVTARTRARIAESIQESMFDKEENAQSPMPDSTGQAIRGVFELRPTVAQGKPMFRPDGAVRSWTLWWRPLPRLMQTSEGEVRPVGVAPGDPVEVATDLAYCRWQVFDNRQRKSDYSAVYFTDLPAYVEMEVQTTSGLWANWMFEVDWATGSENAGSSGEDEAEGTEGSASRTYENLTPPAPATGGDK